MADTSIRAIERTEKPGKARRNGFVPGVIYGKGMSSKSVKFDEKKLKRLLRGHTENAKLNVKVEDEIKQCIIKEIQKDPITGSLLHIELQTVKENDIVKLKVPIVFNGREWLTERKELLQVFVNEIEIMGQATDIPEFISVDVKNKKIGDKITINDIKINPAIKVIGDANEVLAVVTTSTELNIAS